MAEDSEPEPGADLVQIAEARELYEAEMIALKLREAGIDAQVLDQSFRQEPLPNVRAFSVVRVFVPASQRDAAQKVLAQPSSLPDDGESVAEGEE